MSIDIKNTVVPSITSNKPDVEIPIVKNDRNELTLFEYLKSLNDPYSTNNNLKNPQVQYKAPVFHEKEKSLMQKIHTTVTNVVFAAGKIPQNLQLIKKLACPDIPPLLQKIFKDYNVESLHQKVICAFIEKFNLKKVLFENPKNRDTVIKVFDYIFNTISELQNPNKSFIKPEINKFCKELDIQNEQLKMGINVLLGLIPSFLGEMITDNPNVIKKAIPIVNTLIKNDNKSYKIMFPIVKATLGKYGINNSKILEIVSNFLITIAPGKVTFNGHTLKNLIEKQIQKNPHSKTTKSQNEKSNDINTQKTTESEKNIKEEKKLSDIENRPRSENRKKGVLKELKDKLYPSINNYLFSRFLGLLIKNSENSDKNTITHALSSTKSFKDFSEQLSLNFFQKVIVFFPYILKGPFYLFTSAILSLFGKSIINEIYNTIYNHNMDTRIKNQKKLINAAINAANNFFIKENANNQKIINKDEKLINQAKSIADNEKTIHKNFAKYFTKNFINGVFTSTRIKTFINKTLKKFFKIEDTSSTFLKVCFEIVMLPLRILSVLFLGMESIPKIVIRKVIVKILKKIIDHIQVLTTNQEFISGILLKLLKSDENPEKSTQTKPFCHGTYFNEEEINKNLHSLIKNLCQNILPKLPKGEVFEKGSLANSLQHLFKTFISKIKDTNERDPNPLEKYLLDDLIKNNFENGFPPFLVDLINNLLSTTFDNNFKDLITSVSESLGKTSTYNSLPAAKIHRNKENLEKLILEMLQSYIKGSFKTTMENNLKKHLGIKEFPENIKPLPNDQKHYDIVDEASKMTTPRFHKAITLIIKTLYDPRFYGAATNNFLNNIST